jgi:hypothetical protein
MLTSIFSGTAPEPVVKIEIGEIEIVEITHES